MCRQTPEHPRQPGQDPNPGGAGRCGQRRLVHTHHGDGEHYGEDHVAEQPPDALGQLLQHRNDSAVVLGLGFFPCSRVGTLFVRWRALKQGRYLGG